MLYKGSRGSEGFESGDGIYQGAGKVEGVLDGEVLYYGANDVATSVKVLVPVAVLAVWEHAEGVFMDLPIPVETPLVFGDLIGS